jgi:hypothetical protein
MMDEATGHYLSASPVLRAFRREVLDVDGVPASMSDAGLCVAFRYRATGDLERAADAFIALHDAVDASVACLASFGSSEILDHRANTEDHPVDEALTSYQTVVLRYSTVGSPLRSVGAFAASRRCQLLAGHGRFAECVVAARELDEIFGAESALVLRTQVAQTLVVRAHALDQLQRPHEALAVNRSIVARFEGSPELSMRLQIARALSQSYAVFAELDRPSDALDGLDQIALRFSASADTTLRRHVANAMTNRAILLGDLERWDEAIHADVDVIRRFGGEAESDCAEFVASALAHKALGQIAVGAWDEAAETCDELDMRFGGSESENLQLYVARALMFKADALSRWYVPPTPLAPIYKEVERRFGHGPPALTEIAERARKARRALPAVQIAGIRIKRPHLVLDAPTLLDAGDAPLLVRVSLVIGAIAGLIGSLTGWRVGQTARGTSEGYREAIESINRLVFTPLFLVAVAGLAMYWVLCINPNPPMRRVES